MQRIPKYGYKEFLLDGNEFRFLRKNTRHVGEWILHNLYENEENEEAKRKIIKDNDISNIWDPLATIMNSIEYEFFTLYPDQPKSFSLECETEKEEEDALSRAIEKNEGIQNSKDFWKYFHDFYDRLEIFIQRILTYSHQWKAYRQGQVIRECSILISRFSVFWYSLFGFLPPRSDQK